MQLWGGGIANNLITTEEGKSLDARQGKVLNDKITNTNNTVSQKLEKYSGAGAHNGIFRGINLLSKYSLSQIYNMISDGSFSDICIGDYFDITISTSYTTSETVRLIATIFDPYYMYGDTPLTRHHAGFITKNCLTKTHQMNSSHTTAGGYYNSAMFSVLNTYANAFASALGSSHLITRRALLSNAVNTSNPSMAGNGYMGASSDWGWYDVRLQLLSEIQVYGSTVFSSSFYDTGCDHSQLPYFLFNPAGKICKAGGTDDVTSSNKQWWWLKDVVSGANFALVSYYGLADYYSAADAGGVRPFLVIG